VSPRGAARGEVRETRALPERLTWWRRRRRPHLQFDARGGSSGGDFRLSSGTITWRVTVDALTGRVRSSRL